MSELERAEATSARGAENGQEGEEAGAEKGEQRLEFATVALKELRRARRLFRDGGGKSVPPEVNVSLGVANTLALLELAAAIRAHRNAPDD